MQFSARRPDERYEFLFDCNSIRGAVEHRRRIQTRGLTVMKTLSRKNISAICTLAATLFSTSYAHAGPRFLCTLNDPTTSTRFELDLRQDGSEGTFKYSFATPSHPDVADGEFRVAKTSTTWSHFIFTGRDSNADVKLSVPPELAGNSVYLELKAHGDSQATLYRWLQCGQAR